ncbi:hypothetical protein BY458DRAFT_591279 [Sporodiniella umbellata]|nr:hypothetical protein BY458DRAFT_591279 [Sporodiniella umbellata]
MTNQSPHPNSLSPHSKPPTSAFQWPIPQQSNSSEISIREILDHYGNDPELLKCILTAKSEEDKKKSARDTLKAEEARIQLRQMDLEMAREQSKSRGQPYGYGLAPVQQQVLARFNYPQPYPPYQRPAPPPQEHRPPPSPAIPHPHSAHPLCPPSGDYRVQSNIEERSNIKRSRHSISNETEHLSHDKVMEALKAKIQRGNHAQSVKDAKKTKQVFRSMAKIELAVNSPSPKSAKPILPPIDTSVGRVEHTPVEESNSTTSNHSTGPTETTGTKKPSPVECHPDRSLTP